MKVLVTGGSGFIGSHACVVLLQAGHSVFVVDNLSNSSYNIINNLTELTGQRLSFIEGDVRDRDFLETILCKNQIEAVFHFAGLKSVNESVSQPLYYYDCNVGGTIALLRAMATVGVKILVFSSSATVYGEPTSVPVTENCSFGKPANPYGYSKQVIENILFDLAKSDSSWRIARLRYFNPVGAHESGLIGEKPNGVPMNLMPSIVQVALGQREKLLIFGNDYPTPDGTGIRDYVHVMDLVEGHLAALEYLQKNPGLLTVNLGTGYGVSVLEMVKTFEKVSGCHIPFDIVERRPGDIAACWADPTLADRLIGWRATRNIEDMCRDTWRWVSSGNFR